MKHDIKDLNINNILEDQSRLVELFTSGCKHTDEFKIGLEFEKLAVDSTGKAVSYYGEKGIEDFLKHYKFITGSDSIIDNDNLIGLNMNTGSITLEPGSQTEISIIPCKNISQIASIIQEYNFKTAIIGEESGINWIGYGVHPISTNRNIDLIPKKRYEIMTAYLPAKGDKALVMMRETAGIQVNFDYESQQDAMEKLRVSLAISPVITAMFANSPIREGKETGYKSYRALSWLNTDNDRCGLISKKIFTGDFSFEDYANYLLDIPMFFILRNNKIIKATHLTFRQFLKKGLEGYKATLEDWETHATTVFPEVRLKNRLEIRNCDSQRADLMLALPALVKGIIYNPDALKQASMLMSEFSFKDIDEMRKKVPKTALETVIKGIKVSELAQELVKIAEFSLLCNPDNNDDEAFYLEKLKELTEKKLSPADIILKNWNGIWKGKVENLINYSKLV